MPAALFQGLVFLALWTSDLSIVGSSSSQKLDTKWSSVLPSWEVPVCTPSIDFWFCLCHVVVYFFNIYNCSWIIPQPQRFHPLVQFLWGVFAQINECFVFTIIVPLHLGNSAKCAPTSLHLMCPHHFLIGAILVYPLLQSHSSMTFFWLDLSRLSWFHCVSIYKNRNQEKNIYTTILKWVHLILKF